MMVSKALTPLQQVKHELAAQSRAFMSQLPSHIPVERFQRTALTAIQNNPGLLNQDRHSLFLALTKAATDGLLPDGREGALVPFKGQVQWMPMVAGILKKVRQSGQIANWTAHAVFEKDEFDILYGDDDRIHHRPHLDGEPGKVTGAYSIVTFKDGSTSRDYMPWWRIAKAKAAGGSRGGVWDKWPDEMAIKTVLRHHAKMLPQSTDIQGIVEDEMTAAETDYRATIEPQPQGRAALAAALEAPAEDQPAHDPDTGEVTEAAQPEAEPKPKANGGWGGKADAYVEAVNTVQTIGELMELQDQHADTLKAMQDQNNAAYRKCLNAGRRRVDELREAEGAQEADADQEDML